MPVTDAEQLSKIPSNVAQFGAGCLQTTPPHIGKDHRCTNAIRSLFAYCQLFDPDDIFAASAKRSIASAVASALRDFPPSIKMIKTAQPGDGNHGRAACRLTVHGPSVRRVFIQGVVNPILMIVVHVLANETPQMVFVQRDDVVEHLAAAASDPPFRSSVFAKVREHS